MQWSFNLLPLGGFVRPFGEVNSNHPDSFYVKNAFQRFIVLVAGVLINLILPFFLFFFSSLFITEVDKSDLIIMNISKNSPASIAGLKIGDKIISGSGKEIKIGNNMPLKEVPPGTLVHNVELIEGNGGKLARSAGSSVTLSGLDGDYAIIKLSSGETRKVKDTCRATIGVVSNPDQKNIKIGKAGRNRWKGKRPMVRGVAKNPVDHPHGGGEGKTSGGRNPVSPWGQSAKGLKTRKPQKSDQFIISRRKKRNEK